MRVYIASYIASYDNMQYLFSMDKATKTISNGETFQI